MGPRKKLVGGMPSVSKPIESSTASRDDDDDLGYVYLIQQQFKNMDDEVQHVTRLVCDSRRVADVSLARLSSQRRGEAFPDLYVLRWPTYGTEDLDRWYDQPQFRIQRVIYEEVLDDLQPSSPRFPMAWCPPPVRDIVADYCGPDDLFPNRVPSRFIVCRDCHRLHMIGRLCYRCFDVRRCIECQPYFMDGLCASHFLQHNHETPSPSPRRRSPNGNRRSHSPRRLRSAYRRPSRSPDSEYRRLLLALRTKLESSMFGCALSPIIRAMRAHEPLSYRRRCVHDDLCLEDFMFAYATRERVAEDCLPVRRRDQWTLPSLNVRRSSSGYAESTMPPIVSPRHLLRTWDDVALFRHYAVYSDQWRTVKREFDQLHNKEFWPVSDGGYSPL